MPKKSKSRGKGKSSDDEADLESFMASQSVDDIVDYVARGRCHAGLQDQALFEAWKTAMRIMAENPFDENGRMAQYDLHLEIELRGLKPPKEDEDIKDAVAMLSAKIAEFGKKLMRNPDEVRRVGEGLLNDIEEFKSKRDRSN